MVPASGFEVRRHAAPLWASGKKAACRLAALLCLLVLTACRSSEPLRFETASPPAAAVPYDGLLELAFRHNGAYANPFLDATLEVEFHPVGGKARRVPGFYDGDQIWKVRFRPDVTGPWRYVYRFRGGEFQAEGRGEFQCTPSSARGGIRRHAENPHRWVFADGSPYFPVGIQDCVPLNPGGQAQFSIDGTESRMTGGRRVDAEEYFAIYGRAGFNLLRFSQKNCSYALYERLGTIGEAESRFTDALLETARKHGFRMMFGFFGYHGRHHQGGLPGKLLQYLRVRAGFLEEAVENPQSRRTVEMEKRFIQYAVARWGVWADFWELLNERHADVQWTREMASWVHAIDPERKPVATSWEKPELAEIDINAPHWYESEAESDSDGRTAERARKWKAWGKPVIVGEQGNSGMNWDPRSTERMRVRLWTALFEEIALIFWNTSWSKRGMHEGRYSPGEASNIYLGPQERGYVRVLQDFAARLDADVRPAAVSVSQPEQVRAYGLRSPSCAAAYLRHYSDPQAPVRELVVTLETPAGTVEWVDPATGRRTPDAVVSAGSKSLRVPAFTSDLALLVQ